MNAIHVSLGEVALSLVLVALAVAVSRWRGPTWRPTSAWRCCAPSSS